MSICDIDALEAEVPGFKDFLFYMAAIKGRTLWMHKDTWQWEPKLFMAGDFGSIRKA